MAWTSIVDYMKANKQDASFGNRAKLAAQYGIKGYQGTANQNIQLLNHLQTKAPTTSVSAPHPAPHPTIPVAPHFTPQQLQLQAAQKEWFNNYSKQIISGSNNTADLARYNNYAKYLKLTKANVSQDTLHQLSIKALSGDSAAQAYLKAMGVQQQTAAQGLWKGITNDQLNASEALRSAYIKDNPLADFTKQYDMSQYAKYNDMINGNQQMTDSQLKWYHDMVSKWNLSDMTDPYNQQIAQLQKDKQGALDAQDTALNQGIGQMDANSFQQMQQLQQQMSNNGMGDSGIAADAYMRAQMANNQNYQQAYAQAAQNKSDMATQYDTSVYGVKQDQLKNQQDQAAQAAKQEVDQQNAQTELLKVQNSQDQWLTAQTGMVYINGKQVTDKSGNPIHTVDWYKLSETERHNLATETNTATKNSNDYTVAMTKIQADIQKAANQMKYNYDKLDLQSTKVQADINNMAAKLDIAAKNADTAQARAQASMLSANLKSIQTQINAYNKKKTLSSSDKKALSTLKKKLQSVQGQIANLAGSLGK